MEVGDEKLEKGKWKVWVICPDCGCGRLVQKGATDHPCFTGRCRECSVEVARHGMGRYYPSSFLKKNRFNLAGKEEI